MSKFAICLAATAAIALTALLPEPRGRRGTRWLRRGRLWTRLVRRPSLLLPSFRRLWGIPPISTAVPTSALDIDTGPTATSSRGAQPSRLQAAA